MSSRAYLISVAIFSFIGLVFSALSAKVYAAALYGQGSSFCNFSERLNCEAVIGSPWSYLLGIPLSSWGLVYFVGIFFLALRSLRVGRPSAGTACSILTILSGVGTAFSALLFYISETIIQVLCPLCLGVYLATLLLFVVSLFAELDLSLAQKIWRGVKSSFGLFRVIFNMGGEFAVADVRAARLLPIFIVALGYFSARGPILFAGLIGVEPSTHLGDRATIPLNVDEFGGGDFARGNPDAAITIVEFADFQCPWCRDIYPVVEEILERHPDKTYYVLMNYPLDGACNPQIKGKGHENSCYAAHVARCSGEQGKYWEVVEMLFSAPELVGKLPAYHVRQEINRELENLGLDMKAIDECLASDRQLKQIQKDIERGEAAGIAGTPAFWINGKQVENLSFEGLTKLIEDEIARQSLG